MLNSNILQKNQEKYLNLLTEIRKFKNFLTISTNSLSEATKIGNYFKIDDVNADNDEISKVLETNQETINYLNNVIIPSIINKINSLNNDIANAKANEMSNVM